MSDMSIDDLLNYLPTAGNNRSIAVGFEDESALYPLRKILVEIFKNVKEDEDIRNKDNNKKTESRYKKLLSEYIRINKEKLKKYDDFNDKLDKSNEHLEQQVNTQKRLESQILRWTEYILDAFKEQHNESVNLAVKFRDVEKSGVFLKEGFEEIFDISNEMGTSLDETMNQLKKTSPLLARLNGSVGNGVKAFGIAINNIDKNLNLTNSQKMNIFSDLLENMSPDQLMSMSQEQLNQEVNKTAKEMKMLSLATGKSVELISKENAQKEKTAREQAWKRAHKSAAMALKASGLDQDEDVMEFIRTGGVKKSANLLLKMQHDPFAQKFLPEIAKLAARNQLNNETFSAVYQKYGKLAGYKSEYANRASMDPTRMMAGGVSEGFMNQEFYAINDLMKNNNFNPNLYNEYYSDARKNDNLLLRRLQDAKENQNRFNNTDLKRTVGGVEGMSSALLGDKLINKGKSWLLNNLVDSWMPDGAISGAAYNYGKGVVERGFYSAADALFFGDKFNKSVDTFSNAVNKFKNKVKNPNDKDENDPNDESFFGAMFKGLAIKGASWIGQKYLNHKIENGDVSKNSEQYLYYQTALDSLNSYGNGRLLSPLVGKRNSQIAGLLFAGHTGYTTYNNLKPGITQSDGILQPFQSEIEQYTQPSQNNIESNNEIKEYQKKQISLLDEVKESLSDIKDGIGKYISNMNLIPKHSYSGNGSSGR